MLVIVLLACVVGVGFEAWLLASGFFVGREHAQAEQRGIQKFYGNKRANAPWYVGLEDVSWDSDSFVNDLVYPILFGLLTIYTIEIIGALL